MEREVRWARHEIAHLLERTELSGPRLFVAAVGVVWHFPGPQLPHCHLSVQ
jgi:hypothetical protein